MTGMWLKFRRLFKKEKAINRRTDSALRNYSPGERTIDDRSELGSFTNEVSIEVDQYMPGPGDGINPEYVTDAEIEPVEEQPTRARRVSKVKGPRPLPGSGPYVGPLRQQDVGRVAEELTQFLSGHLQHGAIPARHYMPTPEFEVVDSGWDTSDVSSRVYSQQDYHNESTKSNDTYSGDGMNGRNSDEPEPRKTILWKVTKTIKRLAHINKHKSERPISTYIGSFLEHPIGSVPASAPTHFVPNRVGADTSYAPAYASGSLITPESTHGVWGPNDKFNNWRQGAWRNGPYLRDPARKVKKSKMSRRPELDRARGGPDPTIKLVDRNAGGGSISRANMQTCPSVSLRSKVSFSFCVGDDNFIHFPNDGSHQTEIQETVEGCGNGSSTNGQEPRTYCGREGCKGLAPLTWQEELKRCDDRKERTRRREYLREMNAYADMGRARRGERAQNNWGSYHPAGNNNLSFKEPHIAGHGLRTRDVLRGILPTRYR